MASCDPTILIQNANCFTCFSGVMLRAFQIRMLCFESGFTPGCDPAALVDHARCLAGCTSEWQAIKVYALATHLGLNANDQSMIDNAKCLLSCLSLYEMDVAITGLIINVTSTTFTPVVLTSQNLPNLSNCIMNCVPVGYLDAVMANLLVELIGINRDPQYLVNQIQCLICKPYALLKAIEVYLWCLERDQSGPGHL